MYIENERTTFLYGDTAEEEKQYCEGFMARALGRGKQPAANLHKGLLDVWLAGYEASDRGLKELKNDQ